MMNDIWHTLTDTQGERDTATTPRHTNILYVGLCECEYVWPVLIEKKR